MKIIDYDPEVEQHPEYTPHVPEFEEGNVLVITAYDGIEMVETDDGEWAEKRYISDDLLDRYEQGDSNLRAGLKVVYEIDHDNDRVRVSTGGLTKNGSSVWVPFARVLDTDEDMKRRMEKRLEREQKQKERTEMARQAYDRYVEFCEGRFDLDAIMDNKVVPHARETVAEHWPGGTVDVDEIEFFWNTRLRKSAGKAYKNGSVPNDVDGRLAIGLAPEYLYLHGLDELLSVVRHELVHIWQYEHPEGDGGHGPTFRQWVDELDTHRHCESWSRP